MVGHKHVEGRMSPIAVGVVILAGLAGLITGWSLAVVVKAILEEPYDVWEEDEW